MSKRRQFKFVMTTPESFSPKSPKEENNENAIPLDLAEEEFLKLGDPMLEEPDTRWFQHFSPILDQRSYNDGAFISSDSLSEESIFDMLQHGNFGELWTETEWSVRRYYYQLFISYLENQVTMENEYNLLGENARNPILEGYRGLLQ